MFLKRRHFQKKTCFCKFQINSLEMIIRWYEILPNNYLYVFFQDGYLLETYIHYKYDVTKFKNFTVNNLTLSRYADKFAYAMDKQVNRSIIHNYLEMQTTYGATKYAMSSSFELFSKNGKDNGHQSSSRESVSTFEIHCQNVTIFYIHELRSRAIILDQAIYSFVFLVPINHLAYR